VYVHARRNRAGQTYYSFSYVDGEGKRVRLKKAEHPHFEDRAEAEAWASSQAAILASRRDHIARKLSWRSKYYQFEELLERYTTWQRERAPNSWKSCRYYLEHWVFPYFLQEVRSANVNDWHLAFQGFLDWLRRPDARVRRDKATPLAASTINNIVKALNTFLECLLRYNLIDKDAARKCECLPDHLVAHRGFADVILEDEMRAVHKLLRAEHAPAADFFYVLWHTGMRFAELFGLPMTSLFRGEVQDGPLAKELKRCEIAYLGYIYLDSQPAHDDRRREEDGSIVRKPLKSCRAISPKYARVIPIRTKDVWNILATRHKTQSEAFAKKQYGGDKINYALFDDCEWNRTVGALRRVYVDNPHLGSKSYHCCRHSYTTLLVGETRSYFLVRMITGHRSQKAFERYLHVYEQVALAARQESQEIDVL
jgi:integrase